MFSARNIYHVFELIDRKINACEREIFESALNLAVEVFKNLGMRPFQAVRAAHCFREHNKQSIFELHKQRADRVKLVSGAKKARQDLENMFAEDDEPILR